MEKPIKPIENHYLVQVELDNGESYTITSPVYRLLRDKYYDDLEKYCERLEEALDDACEELANISKQNIPASSWKDLYLHNEGESWVIEDE